MNHCSHPVCPVVPSNAGKPSLLPSKGGHITVLHPGQSIHISVSSSWSGSIWGRTPCTKDSDKRKFRILIKDSRSYTEKGGGPISCNLHKPISTTIATFMLNGTDGLDYYEVSFRNGYNLPMLVVPVHNGSGSGSGGHCRTAGCTVNLTSLCPPELRFSEESLGCKSACQAFGDPKFCCTSNGIGLTGNTHCNPNFYREFFKKACPKANSFVDDTSSLFSCPLGQDYSLIFCPSPSTTSNKLQLKVIIPVAIFESLLTALLSALWWWFGDGISICNSNSNNNC
nr:thaumatin-like protein 1b [Ziziphus jujuba var. spinosa]